MHTKKTPSLVGTMLANRYLLTSLLGYGGWGFVYRACDLSKECTQYAIKCIPKSTLTCAPEHVIRREIHLHRLVSGSSPHVLAIRGSFQDKHYVYLVLDLCTGGDMATALYNATFEGKDELIRKVFIQILDGVTACHKKGVYHRDIKPENILFRADGSACITDFGLATKDSTSTQYGIATPLYSAPELLKYGRESAGYSPESADVWALGIVLVNMVVGDNPWPVASLNNDSFRNYTYHRDKFFTRSFPMISGELNKLLKKVLHPFPRRRMTLGELRQEILSIKSFYFVHTNKT